jgi:hypothetical protein
MSDPQPTEVNVPLLRKAIEWAEAEHARVDGQWYQATWRRESECGTSYCIGGYAAQVSGAVWSAFPAFLVAEPEDDPEWVTPDGYIEVDNRARRLLGLTFNEADDLFNAGNTIVDVRKAAERIAVREGERL